MQPCCVAHRLLHRLLLLSLHVLELPVNGMQPACGSNFQLSQVTWHLNNPAPPVTVQCCLLIVASKNRTPGRCPFATAAHPTVLMQGCHAGPASSLASPLCLLLELLQPVCLRQRAAPGTRRCRHCCCGRCHGPRRQGAGRAATPLLTTVGQLVSFSCHGVQRKHTAERGYARIAAPRWTSVTQRCGARGLQHCNQHARPQCLRLPMIGDTHASKNYNACNRGLILPMPNPMFNLLWSCSGQQLTSKAHQQVTWPKAPRHMTAEHKGRCLSHKSTAHAAQVGLASPFSQQFLDAHQRRGSVLCNVHLGQRQAHIMPP